MKNQFYPEPEDGPEAAGAPTDTPPKPEEDAGNETALLPKSMLGECQVGDTITVKVVAEHEGEFEVEKTEETTKEEDGVPSAFGGGGRTPLKRPRLPGAMRSAEV